MTGAVLALLLAISDAEAPEAGPDAGVATQPPLVALAEPDAGPSREPERRLFPAQGDLSATGAIGATSMAAVALYAGFAYGHAPAHGGGALFAGVGPEFTYAFSSEPYRMSLGMQARAGFALTTDDGKPQGGNVTPDLFVYLRVTMFAAGTQTLGPPPAMAPVNKNFAGVRLGLGLTSTYLLRRFFEFGLFSEAPSAVRDVLRVMATLLLLPVVLLDHSELMFEFADARPAVTVAIFRIGTGF